MKKNMLEVVEQDSEKEIYHVGRFYLAIVKDEKGIKGIGISRRSILDIPDEKRGRGIALGRAMKALKMKEEGKKITGNKPFLG